MADITIFQKFQPLYEPAKEAPLLSDGTYRWMTFNKDGFPIDADGNIIPEHQKDLYGHKRYIVYFYSGGRVAGKSEHYALISVIQKAMIEKYIILCCRETFTSIRDSMYETIKTWIYTLGVQDSFQFLESEIRSKTGARYIFKGLRTNAPEIKSTKGIGLCIVDEAKHIQSDVWKDIIPTLRMDGCEFWIAMNTGTNKEDTYTRFAINADDDTYVGFINIADNPLAPKFSLKLMMKSKLLAEKTGDWNEYNNDWLGLPLVSMNGGVFLPSQITIVTAAPICVRYVRGWDLASSAVSERYPDPDYTSSLRMGVTSEGLYVITDVTWMRETADKVEAAIVNTATLDGLGTEQSIAQDPGQAGKSQVLYLSRKLSGFRIHTSTESGDKVVRAGPFSAQVNNGNCVMVQASWNQRLIASMTAFGSGTLHEDDIDAGSRAFTRLQVNYRLQLVEVLGL